MHTKMNSCSKVGMFHAIASPLSRTAAAQRLLCGWVLIAGWINVGCSPIQPQLRSPHDGQASAQAVDSGTDSRSREAQGEDEPLIVRGQNGGYSLPPDLQTPADGGRHQRGPLPVRGQPDATVAQGVELLPPRSGEDSEAGSADLQAAAGEGAVPGYSAAQPPTPPSFQYNNRLPPPQNAVPQSPQSPPPGMPVQQSLPQQYNPGIPGPPIAPVVPPIDGTIFNDPAFGGTAFGPPAGPRENVADLIINGAPGRTGRIMLGGAINSDAGLTGQITLDERNFDITRWPTSFQDLFSGTAFRGNGQTFRIEAMPGRIFQRYTVQFGEPNLFDTNVSLNVSGFMFDRIFRDWNENRLGGRVALGYRITPDLSASLGFQGQAVKLRDPRVLGIPEIDNFLGQTDVYAGQFRLNHDTRDSPFAASQGHLLEWRYEQGFGDFDFPKSEIDYRRYFLVTQRADGSGKHTLSFMTQFGVTGRNTPVFENFFAGGFATLRGFEFRGANPTINGAQVGGRMSWINSIEYSLPVTADDAFRTVAFVDFGTVEQDFNISSKNFRVAPGVGFRVAIPMMGPAPLAFDFAFPIARADDDIRQVFSFYMSAAR